MPQSRNALSTFRHRLSHANANSPKPRVSQAQHGSISEDEEEADPTDRTPLLSSTTNRDNKKPGISRSSTGNGIPGQHYGGSNYFDVQGRKASVGSPDDGRKRKEKIYPPTSEHSDEDYDVNNPPSVPGSPKLGSLEDVMIPEDFAHGRPENNRDAVIDIDRETRPSRSSSHSSQYDGDRRRKTVQDLAEMDVCYPADGGMSELGEEDFHPEDVTRRARRRRRRQWPDLDVLEEWSMEEKKERDLEQIRAKKTTEPVMVGGRLRPSKQAWHREEDDAPYRYTYFIESFDSTIPVSYTHLTLPTKRIV